MSTIIGTRRTELIVDGVNYTDSVSSAILSAGDSDSEFVSFEDALNGGLRKYVLKLTVRQDTDTDSLWYYIWNENGSDVEVEFWPNGGSPTPSATTPRFSGTVTISEPDGDYLGGEANKSPSMVNITEVEWEFTAKPSLTAS